MPPADEREAVNEFHVGPLVYVSSRWAACVRCEAPAQAWCPNLRSVPGGTESSRTEVGRRPRSPKLRIKRRKGLWRQTRVADSKGLTRRGWLPVLQAAGHRDDRRSRGPEDRDEGRRTGIGLVDDEVRPGQRLRTLVADPQARCLGGIRVVAVADSVFRMRRPFSPNGASRARHGSIGKDSTHWRTGTWGMTWSTRCAAVCAMRRAPHDGQNPRRL